MINSTYTAMINEFAANNPDILLTRVSLVKWIQQMKLTPRAISGGRRGGAANNGDANPTNSDLRAYYQFGGGAGPKVR